MSCVVLLVLAYCQGQAYMVSLGVVWLCQDTTKDCPRSCLHNWEGGVTVGSLSDWCSAPVGGIPELRKSIALGPLAKGRCLCHHITKEQPSSCGHWGGVVRAELLLLSVHAGSILGAVMHPGVARFPMSSAAYQSCVGVAGLRESCCCVVAAELVPRGPMCWCTLGRFATGARHRWTVSRSCDSLLLVRW